MKLFAVKSPRAALSVVIFRNIVIVVICLLFTGFRKCLCMEGDSEHLYLKPISDALGDYQHIFRPCWPSLLQPPTFPSLVIRVWEKEREKKNGGDRGKYCNDVEDWEESKVSFFNGVIGKKEEEMWEFNERGDEIENG